MNTRLACALVSCALVCTCASDDVLLHPRAGRIDLLSSLAEQPSVNGFVQMKRGKDELVLLGGPGYVRFPVEVESFRLHLRALLEDGATANVVVRGHTGVIAPSGPRVLLSEDPASPAGSIVDGPKGRAAPPPAGEWFDVDIVARASSLMVSVNGTQANTARLNPGAGFVALEGVTPGAVVRFRAISLDVLD